MNIQEEIHKALEDIQQKLASDNKLSKDDLETLLLTALIEEEAL